jgi:membrane-associated phospholipid phosphatase
MRKYDPLDIVSALPLAFVFHLALMRDWYGILGMFLCEVVTKVIKRTPGLGGERPVAGAKCDLLSCRAYAKGSPGFPSGHVASTAFFFARLNRQQWGIGPTWVAAAVAFMAWVRVRKGCHTWGQALGGAALGFTVSSIVPVQDPNAA